jgi:hypothetical protein
VVARLGFWVLVVEVASLFAEPLNFGFSLLARGVNQPANPGDALILAGWFYIDDETLLIGCANDPPIRESQIRKGEEESQARIPERSGSTANTPLIATFVPDDRIASENRQRMKPADKPAPGTS